MLLLSSIKHKIDNCLCLRIYTTKNYAYKYTNVCPLKHYFTTRSDVLVLWSTLTCYCASCWTLICCAAKVWTKWELRRQHFSFTRILMWKMGSGPLTRRFDHTWNYIDSFVVVDNASKCHWWHIFLPGISPIVLFLKKYRVS